MPDINSNIASALSAYQTANSVPVSPRASDNDAVDIAPQGMFKEMIKSSIEQTIDDSRKAEELSKQAIAGKADMRDVVAAVTNAEMALQTVVAVRDSVIKAYQEVMRMQI